MNILAGIPSYFGTEEVRERRYKAHQIQLEWLRKYKIPAIIYAQDYKKSEYSSDFTYRKYKEPYHWAKFKRIFLKEFYESDYMWGIIMDNDAGLYDHHLGYDIFLHMNLFYKEWDKIDFWYPLDPRKEPFNHLYKEYPEIYKENLVFQRSPVTAKGTMFIIKNPKYSKKKPVLFSSKTSSDDTEFVINCIKNKWNVYKCTSIILKELVDSSKHSTIYWLADLKERAKIVSEEKINFAEKYGIDYTIRKNGGVTLRSKSFIEKHVGKKNKDIIIPKHEKFL